MDHRELLVLGGGLPHVLGQDPVPLPLVHGRLAGQQAVQQHCPGHRVAMRFISPIAFGDEAEVGFHRPSELCLLGMTWDWSSYPGWKRTPV